MIEQAVAAYLTEIGVTFTATACGPTKRYDWECDQWLATFKRADKTLTEDYFTGIGHRKSSRPMPPDIARLGKRILARVEWEATNLKPVPPPAAGVLYSLLLDSRSAESNFLDWCDEFGYDSDSRKHLATYEACCEIRRRVQAFFSADERAKLGELLEDY